MIKYCKRFFGDWNAFELCALFCGIALPIVLGVIFGSEALIIVTSVVAAITSLLFLKAKIEACFLIFASIALYVIVSWRSHLYGEAGYYIIIIFPVEIFNLVNWLRHKTEHNTVTIVNTNKKEFAAIVLSQAIMFVPYYYILQALHTEQVFWSTVSLVMGICACLLIARRSAMGYVFWVLSDIASIILWAEIVVVNGDIGAIPLIALIGLLFVLDNYGLYSWIKIKNKQRQRANELVNNQVSSAIVEADSKQGSVDIVEVDIGQDNLDAV